MNRTKIRIRKFFISFSITLAVLAMLGVGAYAALRMAIRPPQVEEFVVFTVPVTSPPTEAVTQPEVETYPLEEELPYMELPDFDTLIFQRRPDVFTFLIFGLDDGNNADTVMVATFDVPEQEINLISIPRDTRVDANRRVGLRKIVASYSHGRINGGGHEGGVNNIKDEVATLIGFRPDFYVSLNERGFVRMINAIGGVEVTVPFHMRYDDPYQNLHIDLPAGRRRLNGQQALHFARFRLANEGFRGATDLQRAAHQQQILHGVAQEVLSVSTIPRIPELVNIYRENVNTNLSPLEMAWFLEQLPHLNIETLLNTYTLPIARTERNGWYEIPDAEEVLALVNRTINPFNQDIPPEMLRIIQ